MKKKKFKFVTPLNDGPLHLADIIVNFEVDQEEEITIISVNYRQTLAAAKVAEISYLLREHAPFFWQSLMDMAENVKDGKSFKLREG